jgi:hypothetical protein
MALCGNNSLFGGNSQFIKFQNGDIIAVEGVNTVERLITSNIRIPYKQTLKSRIILKAGQVNYLLNHLGLGDNATFLAIKATYNSSSVNEEDNYILWNYYDNFNAQFPMDDIMILTGNSENRIKQLYLTNPNDNYAVTLDILVASIDDTYSYFTDTTGQTGTSFTGLESSDIISFVVNESIVVNDTNSNALIYIQLSNINSIERSVKMVTIDDDSAGTIILVFNMEAEAAQAHSKINYALTNSNINLTTLTQDTESPVVYWNDRAGATGSYISFNGATAGVPYNTGDGLTFSTSLSFSAHMSGGFITKATLIDLLVGSVSDNRDGLMSITSSAINLTNTISVDSISGTGSYYLTLNITDLALNDLSAVNMTLTID